MKIYYEIEFKTEHGGELEREGFDIEVDVTRFVNKPARLYGRWEDSYPAETEIEFTITDCPEQHREFLESDLSFENAVFDQYLFEE